MSHSKSASRPALTRSLSERASTRAFKDDSYSSHLLKGLHKAYLGQHLCDITLLSRGVAIKAHRVVLAAFSSYFEAMFDFKGEDIPHTVDMSEIESSLLMDLINFAYTGEIAISGENVQELLMAASFLSVQLLMSSCCQFISDNMDPSNCLSIASFASAADFMGSKEVYQKARDYAVLYFKDIIREQDFLESSTSVILDVINDKSLMVTEGSDIPSPARQEELICKALMRHIEHNIEERAELLPQVLQTVRLPLLLPEISNQIEESVAALERPNIMEECQNIFVLARELHSTSPQDIFSEKDPIWARARGGAFLEFSEGPKYAHGYVNPEVEYFTPEFQDQHTHVKGVKMWIRRWDGRPCLGALQVWYSDGSSEKYGEETSEDNEFHLEDDEKIIKIIPQTGWMIDNLIFITNKNRTFGPYGGDGGGIKPDDEPPEGCYGHLASISGAVVDTQGSLGITSLSFMWAYYPYLKKDQ